MMPLCCVFMFLGDLGANQRLRQQTYEPERVANVLLGALEIDGFEPAHFSRFGECLTLPGHRDCDVLSNQVVKNGLLSD